MRRILLFIALGASLPSGARADTLTLSDSSGTLGSADRAHWVNRSRCSCGTEMTATLDLSGLSSGGRVELVAGKSCVTSDAEISDACWSLWSEKVGSGDAIRTTTFSAEALADGCSGSAETTLSVWLLYDAADSGSWANLSKLDVGVDLRAPVAPTATKVVAGEKLVEVVFEAGSDDEEKDSLDYQVLCTTTSGGAVKSSPPTAGFDSAGDRCGDGTDSVLSATFVCAEANSGAGSVTVQGLEDGTTYEFSVVAIDAAKNPSARVVVGEATPALEEDFWERYQRSGGLADGEGTGCTAAVTARHSPAPLVVLLVVVLALVWRRR